MIRPCDGCDELGLSLTKHVLTFREPIGGTGETTDTAHYCEDCLGLARADWAGTIAAVDGVPTTREDE